jgi:hypothetical protein
MIKAIVGDAADRSAGGGNPLSPMPARVTAVRGRRPEWLAEAPVAQLDRALVYGTGGSRSNPSGRVGWRPTEAYGAESDP